MAPTVHKDSCWHHSHHSFFSPSLPEDQRKTGRMQKEGNLVGIFFYLIIKLIGEKNVLRETHIYIICWSMVQKIKSSELAFKSLKDLVGISNETKINTLNKNNIEPLSSNLFV